MLQDSVNFVSNSDPVSFAVRLYKVMVLPNRSTTSFLWQNVSRNQYYIASMLSVISIKESNFYGHSHKVTCNARVWILVHYSHNVLNYVI